MNAMPEKYRDLPELFPKRTSYSRIPKKWKGQDVYIVGGGPGFAQVNPKKLIGKNVIGCNDACLLGSDVVDLCYFLDETWYESIKLKGVPFKGKFATASRFQSDPDLLVFEPDHQRGCNTEKNQKISTNGNTGLSAICLAYKMGAKRIILLGMNMDHDVDGRHHWHDENLRAPTSGLMRNRRSAAYEIYEDLRDEKVEIINATPGSMLAAWPAAKPSDVGVGK